MSLPPSRSVYIAHTQADEAIAKQFRETLEICFGSDVSISKFTLESGTSFYRAISDAITEANWFFLLLTKSAVSCEWVKTELDLATIHSIENLGFKFVVLKFDNVKLPKEIEISLTTRLTVNLSNVDDWEGEFLNIAAYIQNTVTTSAPEEVYVGRGADEDQFALRARNNKIIFIQGWIGIGKSTFIKQSVARKLRKHPLTIKLTQGYSIDFLARQVIRKARVQQPIRNRVTNPELVQLAIEALKKRADGYFLFIDDAESGLDTSNTLLHYLESFLERFINADVNSHIVVATTRVTHYAAQIANSSSLLRLKGLHDEYIEQSVEMWLKLNGQNKEYEQIRNTIMMTELVELIGGYPLAAKLAADSLSVLPIKQLLETSKQRTKFQLKFAAHILRSTELTHLKSLILQVLTTVDEPMILEDMLSISEFNKYTLEDIKEAKIDLVDSFLIEQEGEMLSLHNFIKAYYRDELRRIEDRQDLISREYGHYAFNKVTELSQELDKGTIHDSNEITVSNKIFQYAVSAGRLLRRVGEDQLAERLCIQIEGTLKEMVYYFYQDKEDYAKAIEYANLWLKINPNDLEIKLYQARCYRNIGSPKDLEIAKKLISEIERKPYNKRFQENIYREKALIAERQGNNVEAKSLFRKGIQIHVPYSYPGNHIGLAELLLREADELPYGSETEQQDIANEALNLLETARCESDQFDRFHLQVYIQALIQAGKEQKAFPLLKDALEDNPNDSRLNYRMAEIKRKAGEYAEAIDYAVKARKFGYQNATLTIANSMYSQALSFSDTEERNKVLKEALNELQEFRPQYGQVPEVADAIASKIYREMGNFVEARKVIIKYESSQNSYTVYELCQVDYCESSISLDNQEYSKVYNLVESAINRINIFEQSQHSLPESLYEILVALEERKEQVTVLINSQ
ncbi:TIR domain-containing protein [Microcoleus sp. ZQ-A2]|nr:TIR domain-containing protein [Microcoleus sp. FACHB-1]